MECSKGEIAPLTVMTQSMRNVEVNHHTFWTSLPATLAGQVALHKTMTGSPETVLT